MRFIQLFTFTAGLVCVQLAAAQVFKCTEVGGKTVYSETPCTKTGSKEQQVKITKSPPAEPRSVAAGVAAKTAAKEASDAVKKSDDKPTTPLFSQLPPTNTGPSDQQIIADCKANRGVRCDSPGEIAQRRKEQTPMTMQDLREAQAERRSRRDNEIRRGFNRP